MCMQVHASRDMCNVKVRYTRVQPNVKIEANSGKTVQELHSAALFAAAAELNILELPTACGSAVRINASQAAIVADGNAYVDCVAVEPRYRALFPGRTLPSSFESSPPMTIPLEVTWPVELLPNMNSRASVKACISVNILSQIRGMYIRILAMIERRDGQHCQLGHTSNSSPDVRCLQIGRHHCTKGSKVCL